MRSLVLVVAATGAAHAAPLVVSGVVTDAHGRWTEGGDRIVTDSTIMTADGPVVVTQLGGSADGYGMRTYPPTLILSPGMRVAVTAHLGLDLRGVQHVELDSVALDGPQPYFVRTGKTKHGNYLYWKSGCIFVTEDSDGTKEIPGDQEFPVIDASIATWNTDTASCSYLKVMSQGKQALEVNGKDSINVIKFRDVSWCRPATHDDPAKCYSDSSAGITTATYVDDGSDRDGEIVDADIELNGVNFAISVAGQTLATGKGCNAELQNTLTHELGHLHGLEHTCLASGDPPRTDDQGNPVPMCGTTSDPKIVDATMYNFQDCDETKKETLEPDDINSMCVIYPTSKDPGTCVPVSIGTGCCSASREPPWSAMVLSGLGLALLRRRKTRRPAP